MIAQLWTWRINKNAILKQIFQKSFKSAGIEVQGTEFVVLFGTYTIEHTEQIAKANAAAERQQALFILHICAKTTIKQLFICTKCQKKDIIIKKFDKSKK